MAWEEPGFGKQPKAISGSNVLFPTGTMMGNTPPVLPPVGTGTNSKAVLPAPAWHTPHVERAIPEESTGELLQQHPAPPPGPRFRQGHATGM